MRPVKSLLFDLDGTLVDSAQDITNALNMTLKNLGLSEVPKNQVQEWVGDGVKTLLTRATGMQEEAWLERAVELFKGHYDRHCNDFTQLYPGVSETLQFFQGKKLGVVSNKPYPFVLKTLEHLAILGRFETVMGAESAANRKPHPEPILKSLKQMGVDPKDAIIVGDGLPDMQAGKAAGVLTCAVAYGYRDRKELQALKPDFMIERFEELTKLVN